jgi:hypothetical protein
LAKACLTAQPRERFRLFVVFVRFCSSFTG